MKEDCIFSRITKSGKMWLYIHLSAAWNSDAGLNAIWGFVDDCNKLEDNDPCLQINFRLSDVLESALVNFGLFGDHKKVLFSGKRTFDVMRAELIEMVSRIDSLEYTDPKS